MLERDSWKTRSADSRQTSEPRERAALLRPRKLTFGRKRYNKGVQALTRTVFAVYLLSLAAGWFPGCAVKYRAEEVMWTPRTEVGRQVKKQLKGSFEQVIEEIQESPEPRIASLKRGGLMLAYRTEHGSDSALHVLLHLKCREVYNTCGTNYRSRAASAYSATLMPVARVLSSHPEIFDHERIAGAAIALDWGAAAYLTGWFRLHAHPERMIAWIPEHALFDYAQLRCTIHELAVQTVFESSKGPTELEFGRAP